MMASDKRCKRATPAAGFRAAVITASSMRITSNTGQTSIDNLVLMCRRHHRLVHEGGFGLEKIADGRIRFTRPDGRVIDDHPGYPAGPSPHCAALISRPTRSPTHRRGSFQLMIWTTTSQSADCCRCNKSGYRPRRQLLDWMMARQIRVEQ
jgi:hypothetical protein